jgi:hypothetical protein
LTRLVLPHELQQLLGQGLSRLRADLFALAAHARGDGEDLSGDRVVALVRLAVDLGGYPRYTAPIVGPLLLVELSNS